MSTAISPEQVKLELATSGVHLSLLRTVAASITSRLDYTFEEIEDAKLVTEEAAALLVNAAKPDALLSVTFSSAQGVFSATLSIESDQDVDRDSYAWVLLEALTDELSVTQGDVLTLWFAKKSYLEKESV